MTTDKLSFENSIMYITLVISSGYEPWQNDDGNWGLAKAAIQAY
jgi:hypothetical protein